MIKALTVALCLGLVIRVQAQDYDKVAQLTCDCLSKKDLSKIDPKMAQTEMGLCLLEAAKDAGIEVDLTDKDALTKMGVDVGTRMAGICLELLVRFSGADNKDEEEVEVLQEIAGTVKSVQVGDFVYVVLEEAGGRETKFLWLRYFEGSDEFIDNPKKLNGKKVTLSFREVECYVPKANGYYKQKEIAALKVQ